MAPRERMKVSRHSLAFARADTDLRSYLLHDHLLQLLMKRAMVIYALSPAISPMRASFGELLPCGLLATGEDRSWPTAPLCLLVSLVCSPVPCPLSRLFAPVSDEYLDGRSVSLGNDWQV